MKAHPRIRKTVKWAGAVVTVLLVVVWIGSGWWSVWWEDGRTTMLGVQRGQIAAVVWTQASGHPSGGSAVRITAIAPRPEFRWGFLHRDEYSGSALAPIDQIDFSVYAAPLWPAVAAAALLYAVQFRRSLLARRCARLNLCLKCHYDRTGLAPGAVCPECGAATAG